ncbi:primosomal protein N' [Fodinicurvata halophila]|uniref:Replication restart protein PriA n=2 Tax=Fodinicurvata halophila TaxID=1419723 RepID=A0ABV8UHL2_9PROT
MVSLPASLGADEEVIEGGSVVAVLLPLPLEQPYSYHLPETLSVTRGTIVEVPLGQRRLPGVVWGRQDSAEVSAEKLKSVARVHSVPAMSRVQRRFITWVAGYTLAPPGAVLRMAVSVPAALDPPEPQRVLTRSAQAVPEDFRLTEARRRVLELAEQGFAHPPGVLAREAGVSTSVVKGLVEAGLLDSLAQRPRAVFAPPDAGRCGHRLSEGQAAVAETLSRKVTDSAFSVTLLDGVTGSGKTEVYFEAVAAALAQGRQVLVLQPEIALSSQWIERFERRFGVRPAEWHSDLTPAQRRITWRAVADGEARVLVGARSSLFLPFQELGLIVVDEEHDPAYKQEDGVIYQARDMAVVRGQLGQFAVILASATPSLESVLNVRAGKYEVAHLPARHGGASLPEVAILDMRRDRPERLPSGGQSWLAPSLRKAITETLEQGEQALLFLNRRGYAPLTLCRACGHRIECPDCTAWLVEHRQRSQLQCHHCGYRAPLPRSCPSCGEEDSLVACGPGVERLEEEVRILFPEARHLLLSSDTLPGPAAAQDLMRQIQEREVDLIVGTQIVAKGHHFPWLTLVGVVDADLGLNGGDLRAAERTYQLLQQVAGRAGRAERPGRVLLQSYLPEHPVLQALQSGDREAFLEHEADTRERGFLPPFSRMAALIVSAPDGQKADEAARALARTAPRAEGLDILGPAPAPLAVLRGRHRRRFLVKARRDLPLQKLLADWRGKVPLRGGVRLAIDIDPYSFL